MSSAPSESKAFCARWPVVAALVVALALHLWGIKRDLPFAPDSDEPAFVSPAVAMAATGNANPRWFGHPGSTVIYPLAAFYGVWQGSKAQAAFDADPYVFYLLGRLLSIAYAVLSLPLVYAIGRRVFDRRVACVAVWLAALHPVAVMHAQMVRTDSAGTFFTLLGLWLCLRLRERPTLRNHLAAGAAIGLGIATRYFMVLLALVLAVVDAALLKRSRGTPAFARTLREAVAGFAAVPLAFAVSTPFFFLDLASVVNSLGAEAEASHPGADGLSPIGNFLWYATTAIPGAITWPQVLLAILGAALAWRARHVLALSLLVGFPLIFVGAISTSNLHWQRWIIQLLPLFALLAAKGAVALADFIGERLRGPWAAPRAWTIVVTALALALPLAQIVLMDLRGSRPSSRVLAREWILQNIPAGTRIAQEWYAAPLSGTGFAVAERFSLAEKGKLEAYPDEGYRYVVASSYVYDRFFAEPGRYAAQIAFYRDLFARGRLMQRWEPSSTRGGPAIAIYELSTR
jgi:4-amino-4-deoxy-L-arabinose transferase-like glycosyltransferase